LRGPERAPVLQYLISGAVSAAEARAFGQEARRTQVLDVSASPEAVAAGEPAAGSTDR
jgi:hypothetical protein